jgi:3-isopropylmalate/(R)-2-methylmalate dehydratase small subunit
VIVCADGSPKDRAHVMSPFTSHTGIACPLGLANVDTDQLIPARFLKRAKGSGLGDVLLADLRNDDFPLNREPWQRSTLMIARRNFGSGSSREAAVYALAEFGIRAVLAPSFGDIFASNAVKNGLLPAIIDDTTVDDLLNAIEARPDLPVTVDLTSQTVSWGNRTAPFAIDPVWRDQLLNGWDDVQVTQSFAAAIAAFKIADAVRRPWMRPAKGD